MREVTEDTRGTLASRRESEERAPESVAPSRTLLHNTFSVCPNHRLLVVTDGREQSAEPGTPTSISASEQACSRVPFTEDGVFIVDAKSGRVLESLPLARQLGAERIDGDALHNTDPPQQVKILHNGIRDITPHMRLLRRARKRERALAAANRSKDEFLATLSHDDDGLTLALINVLECSAHAEAQLLEGERAQVTLDSIGDGVISTDVAGNITYLNPIAGSMTGWSPSEAYGRPLQEVLQLVDGNSRDPAVNPLAMAILHNTTVGLSPNCVLIRRDGQESAIEDTAAPIRDRLGQVIGGVIVFHDVSKARAMSLRMSYLAQHDFLTGLPNRMLLNDRLSQAIALAHRHHSSLAVLFADVDDFKGVNDSLGHAIGDQLLQSISRRLVACVRDTDTVCRLGGDEFVVLLSEVAHPADAALSSDKILTALRTPHRIEQRDLKATVSIGIGVYPDAGKDAETLLKNADAALSHAKAKGGNTHQIFEQDMLRAVGDLWLRPASRM